MTISFHLTQFCPLANFGSMVLGMLMAFLSVFLIMLILLQRGRGGGLSGALGGAGGQSAFGSKAGDTFTVLTISLAGVWIFVCAFAMWSLGMHAPAVADLIEPEISAGPGSDDAEDITSGLVIPTNEENDSNSGTGDLVPAGSDSETSEDSVSSADDAAVEETEELAADDSEPSAESTTE
ncbi:preprotein translocase subunit SecG [Aporhodopirellula aestuarii]|uniref:Protein-export membrane protein SecG n=1 Tax=Aporhodopirellula aestuarii TaxID=2950107 RepID=A0ABT0U820_9BACT|nr:preprotein translocase subunit SecG [Aporhodopirellula aestuarii]MCM2372563.1 preprotein translocase subunit SecG [Aporhodopirellula aestuarii]